ncbi:MAG: sigma-70 family RNA polymerase sigma factor, partial [Planctomycetes bacterium]|nr:sigma-70 family RNA polymerase sigma factor [Planctomycetota bacterium]
SNVGTALHSSPLWQHLSGSVISPRSEVDRAEQTERLLLELGRLKDSYREIITLAFFDQLPVRDIAEQMNVTPRAASMMLLRAVRTLQERMRPVIASGPDDG